MTKTSSKITYTVRGSVRGTVYEGTSQSAAIRALAKDRRDCKRLGGGAYSDCVLYRDGQWVDTSDPEEYPTLA